MKPRLSHSSRGATLVSMAILIGLIAILTIASVSFLGNKIQNIFSDTSNQIASDHIAQPSSGGGEAPAIEPEPEPEPIPAGPVDATTYVSCNDAYQNGGFTESGVYILDLGGVPTNTYCTMLGSDHGALAGGWQAVAWQYESSPVSWGSGIDPSRAEADYLNTSFSLSAAQVPTHTAIAYGSGNAAGMVEIIDAVSTSGPIPADYFTYLSTLATSTPSIPVKRTKSITDPSHDNIIYLGIQQYWMNCSTASNAYRSANVTARRSIQFRPDSVSTVTSATEIAWGFNYDPQSTTSNGACYLKDAGSTSEANAYTIWVR